jgi:signal transduction histidine kinase
MAKIQKSLSAIKVWFAGIITVPILSPEQDGKRKVLRMLLWVILFAVTLSMLSTSIMVFINIGNLKTNIFQAVPGNVRVFFYSDIAILALVATFLQVLRMNVRVEFTAFLFVFLLQSFVTFVDTPEQILGGRSFVAFVFPIIISCIVIAPKAGFFFAAMAVVQLALLNEASGQRYYPLVVWGAIIYFSVAIIGWIGFQVLQQAIQEARRQADDAGRLRSRILGIVSHEMRTPINVIEMSAEAVLAGAFPVEKDRDAVLSQIVDGSRQLEHLVEDLIDQTRLDIGTLDLRLQSFRVRNELLVCVLERYRLQADATGLALSGHVADDVPDVLVGDVSRLAQVLGNLVENAIKFTCEGSVHVEILREGGTWGFDVTDTGIGIAGSDLDEIWKSFRMVDDSRARLDQHGGLGLGLAIVSGLVAAMGGTRSVESELGQGSTFRVRLPLLVPEESR